MAKKNGIQKGVPDSIARKIREEATLLMHCYNFRILFPTLMNKLKKEIINDLIEEGASSAYIIQLGKRASYMSWFGKDLNKMHSRLREMKEMANY